MPGDGGTLEESVEFVDHSVNRARQRAGIAPPEASTIVADHAKVFREFRANFIPAQDGGHETSFEENRREPVGTGLTDIEQMKAMRSEIDENPWWRIEFEITAGFPAFDKSCRARR